MTITTSMRWKGRRHGGATVELAFVLPFLCFMFVIAVDYARVFYFGITLENCARNGAYYASNYPDNNYVYNNLYGYKSLDDAVLRDASNLSPTPTYTVGYGSSSDGPFTASSSPANGGGYVQVTVTWTFNSITNYPGVPKAVTLNRSAIMQVAPAMPSFTSK
jgi:Flp pilus assembly protein TadG